MMKFLGLVLVLVIVINQRIRDYAQRSDNRRAVPERFICVLLLSHTRRLESKRVRINTNYQNGGLQLTAPFHHKNKQ